MTITKLCIKTLGYKNTKPFNRLKRRGSDKLHQHRPERMSPSPTIITTANPEWFYNSKIMTLHKDTVIALGYSFSLQMSIHSFFLGPVLKYIWGGGGVRGSWKPPHEKMRNFSWKHKNFHLRSSLALYSLLSKHPRIVPWHGVRYLEHNFDVQKLIIVNKAKPQECQIYMASQ